MRLRKEKGLEWIRSMKNKQMYRREQKVINTFKLTRSFNNRCHFKLIEKRNIFHIFILARAIACLRTKVDENATHH